MNPSVGADSAPGKRAIYVAAFAVMLVGCVLSQSASWHGSAQLHTLMELAATLLALIVGILALVRFYSKKENTFLFLATGFIGTGLLDGYHALVSAQDFVRYFPSAPPSLIPWSGFAARLSLSVLLWLSWALWRKESAQRDGRVPESLVYALVGAWTLACFLFFALAPLPLAYKRVPLFHRPQEFIPAALALAALAGYLRKGRWQRDPFEHWLVLAIILWIGQSILIATSDKLFDAAYMASHVLKTLSYISTLAGLIVAMYYLFMAEESIVSERTETLQQEIAERKRAEAGTKPIGQAELLDAIRHVLGTKDKHGHRAPALVTRRSMHEGKTGLRILLAEDNLVNRTVAVRLLERHGYQVEVAADGRDALRKLQAMTFDLVLMDVQMPNMDGFQATQAIRETEKTRGGHLPIIAMTAHALKGDRERCLAAAMDGYISKPFRIEELIAQIQALPSPAQQSLVWERGKALSYLEGNANLLDDLLHVFTVEWPVTRERLHRACAQRDPKALAAVMHLLKGELPCLGCVEAGDLAGRIENMVLGKQWDAAQPELARLESSLEMLVEQWRKALEPDEVSPLA